MEKKTSEIKQLREGKEGDEEGNEKKFFYCSVSPVCGFCIRAYLHKRSCIIHELRFRADADRGVRVRGKGGIFPLSNHRSVVYYFSPCTEINRISMTFLVYTLVFTYLFTRRAKTTF